MLYDSQEELKSFAGKAGHDIRTVQDLMGHKVIAMTVRYSHLSAPHKRSAVASLPRYANEPEAATGTGTALAGELAMKTESRQGA